MLAALLLFGVLLLCGTFVRGALPVFRPSGVPERSVIVIDAGHGGEDGGAVAADGTVESGINLAIAQDLDALLRLLGCETKLTRTEDTAIYSAFECKTHIAAKVTRCVCKFITQSKPCRRIHC